MNSQYIVALSAAGSDQGDPASAAGWPDPLLHARVGGHPHRESAVCGGRQCVCHHPRHIPPPVLLRCPENRHENEDRLLLPAV